MERVCIVLIWLYIEPHKDHFLRLDADWSWGWFLDNGIGGLNSMVQRRLDVSWRTSKRMSRILGIRDDRYVLPDPKYSNPWELRGTTKLRIPVLLICLGTPPPWELIWWYRQINESNNKREHQQTVRYLFIFITNQIPIILYFWLFTLPMLQEEGGWRKNRVSIIRFIGEDKPCVLQLHFIKQ